ncbi:hypothetical protein B0O99DRAFT_692394 [Bisporella sp. PMI_857]|nr:hypothetical protein B0O99DRAFT_692394 [Bisporella sp. PMI_857]
MAPHCQDNHFGPAILPESESGVNSTSAVVIGAAAYSESLPVGELAEANVGGSGTLFDRVFALVDSCFEDDLESDTGILETIDLLLWRSDITMTKLAGDIYHQKIAGHKMGNWTILNSEASNSDGGHGRTALQYTVKRHERSVIAFDNFGKHFDYAMRRNRAINPNNAEAYARNGRLRQHLGRSDEDDMSSVSSNDQESLFEHSPSETDTVTTVGSSAVQQEMTYTNIEHMLAVLKAERGKCLGEIREFDAALEIIDQLTTNRNCTRILIEITYEIIAPLRYGLRREDARLIRGNSSYEIQTVYDTSCRDDYESPFLEAEVNVGTTYKNKCKELDSPEAAQLAFSSPSEHMGSNLPADYANAFCTAEITPIPQDASVVMIHDYGQNLRFLGGKAKEPKICWECPEPKTMKDTPALKRHCSEVHKQDINGNPISIELFPCPITACHKHTEPFKRREKRAHHIRSFHAEIIQTQEPNSVVSLEKGGAALTTNNTAEAGNDFEENHGEARVSARVYHDYAKDSAKAGVGYAATYGEIASSSIEVQLAPVAKAYGIALCTNPYIPVDTNYQPSSRPEKPDVDTTNSSLDAASMYTFSDSPLEIDINRTTRDAADILITQMANEGRLGSNGVIDPALIQSVPSGGKLLNQSSPSPLPEFCSGFFRQITTGGWPVTVDKTVTVQYDTLDEAKQALLDAREKTLQKLHFITQQIENLEERKRKRNEAVGGLEGVEGSFF